MNFKKYRSLENLKQRFVNIIEDHGYANEPYIVTEKIHGANFGIHYSSSAPIPKFSRRNGFLQEGEDFYNHTSMIESFIDSGDHLKALFPDASVIRIYGEIFGGYLDGVQMQGAKRVQGSVFYSPKNEFMAFEVQVDDVVLSVVETVAILHRVGIPFVPIVGWAESLTQALDFPNDTNSAVPALLGYESPLVNIKEGNVILPVKHLVFSNGNKVILKDKNDKFKESKTPRPTSTPVKLSEQGGELLNELLSHVTENRLENVLSKEQKDNLTGKDFGRILGLLIVDCLDQYEEDHPTIKPKTLADEEWPAVNKVLNKEVQVVVREYFKKHIF